MKSSFKSNNNLKKTTSTNHLSRQNSKKRERKKAGGGFSSTYDAKLAEEQMRYDNNDGFAVFLKSHAKKRRIVDIFINQIAKEAAEENQDDKKEVIEEDK